MGEPHTGHTSFLLQTSEEWVLHLAQ